MKKLPVKKSTAKKRVKYVGAPLGYKIEGGDIRCDDEVGLRNLWRSMGLEPPAGESCKEMVKNLVEYNGFQTYYL